MKRILFCLLLLSVFVCFGCQNNNNNDEFFEEVDVEEIVTDENTDENDTDVIKDINTFFKKGNEELDKGNAKEAIEQFNKALKINDKADWVYGDLGRAKEANKDLDGAIECYTKAIELNNKRSVYYDWRATAYKISGKEDLAEKDKQIADELHAKGMD